MALTPMTCASRTSAHAPAFVHFSAINRTERVRVSSNITGLRVGGVRNLTAAGTGTLGYLNSGKTLTYQAPGDSAGTPVVLSQNIYGQRLYSGNGVDWVYFDVIYASLPGSDQTDTLTITAMRSTGVVQPTQVVAAGVPDYPSQQYLWNFGDANAISYEKTNSVLTNPAYPVAKSSNTCYPAAVSGHLFTTPGTYTVSMRCYKNDGATEDYEEAITITDQAATASIFYCDSSRADDSGNGLTPATAKKTFAAAMALRTNNCIIRFKRGGSYTAPAAITLAHNDLTLTSYYNADGTDDANQALPLITLSHTSDMFSVANASDLKIYHLEFVGMGATAAGGFIRATTGGSHPNLLLYNVKVSELNALYQVESGSVWRNTGVGVVDCSAINLKGVTSAAGVFAAFIRGGILGTRIGPVSGAEVGQCCRVTNHDEPIIADNFMEGPRSASNALTVRATDFPTSLLENVYACVLRNYLDGLPGSVGFHIGRTNSSTDERVAHPLVWGNAFIGGAAGQVWNATFSHNIYSEGELGVSSNVVTGSSYCRSFNEIRVIRNYNSNNAAFLLNTFGASPETYRDPFSSILRNSITYLESGTSTGVGMWSLQDVSSAEINSDCNIVFGAGSRWSRNRPDGGSESLLNLASTQSTYSQDLNSFRSDPKFVDSTSNNFRLQATSPAIDAGDDAYLGWTRIDRDGNLRTGATDIGPYEYGASDPGWPVPATGGANRANRLSLRLGVGF